MNAGGAGSGASHAPQAPSAQVSVPASQRDAQARSATGTAHVDQAPSAHVCVPGPQAFEHARVATGTAQSVHRSSTQACEPTPHAFSQARVSPALVQTSSAVREPQATATGDATTTTRQPARAALQSMGKLGRQCSGSPGVVRSIAGSACHLTAGLPPNMTYANERFILAPMHGESRQTGAPPDGDASALNDVAGMGEEEGAPQSGSSAAGTPGAPSQSAADTSDPLGAAQAEAARMKEAWLRSAADFDNFRKRTRRELEDARRAGREDLLKTLLPVFDNLERAIQSAQRAADVKAVSDGLSMVLRQFVDALGREGISRVPTIGKPFDPTVHEAIQQVETGEHEPGTVIAEVQPGYLQGGRLMRAAMVVVARPKSDNGAPSGGAEAAS